MPPNISRQGEGEWYRPVVGEMELRDWGGSRGGYSLSSYWRDIGEPTMDSPLTVWGRMGGGEEYRGEDIICCRAWLALCW